MASSEKPPVHPDTAGTTFSIEGLGKKFDTREAIQPYLDQLEIVHNVEEIRFGGNTLGVDACAALGELIATKPTLKIANFSDIFTGRLISEIPQSLRSLCSSLLQTKNLTSVDFSDNAFGGRSVEPMLEFISSHPSLQILKLNNNGMGPAGGEMLADALLKNAEKARSEGRSPTLRTLVCGRNRLENGSSLKFGKAFSALRSLVELRMPQNGIRMEGIEAIVQALRSNADLEILDLQDNTATEQGSRAIAASLPSWPKLRVLNLSDCLLRPRGGVFVANALNQGSNKKLESLKLQSNELDARSINIFSSAIEHHLPDLIELELNGNYGEAEDECYANITKALQTWDHADALDELDELEEKDEESEKEDSSEGEEDESGDEVINTRNGLDPVAQASHAQLKENGSAELKESSDPKKVSPPKPLEEEEEDIDSLTTRLNKVHVQS